MASEDIRWVRMQGFPGLGLRLPLYSGKLDLLAIARCFDFDPAGLCIRVILREKQEDEDDDSLVFHSISIDYSTGLSRLTWDEIDEEVSLVYGAPFPDGKTQENSVVINGGPLTGSVPAWLSKLSAVAAHRAVVDLERLICHRFVSIFRECLQVDDLENIFNDKSLVDIFFKEPFPEEEDTYIDRHISPTALPPLFDCCIPESYHWLQPEEIAKQTKVFPVKTVNLDVEVRGRSTAVLAHGSDAVLGIDLVSDMSQLGLNRCEVEFYLWDALSSLPHLQLITDLKTGAVVFYFKDDSVIARETMSVDGLQAFLRAVVSTLPLDAASRTAWSVLKRIKRATQ